MTDPADFRWQSLFQHSGDALFVLNRRRRLLFVNHAWEALAGLPLAEVRGLACRRARPATPSDSLAEILAHALCPPPEVLDGQSARARRLLPARAGARWWDVEFFPLFQADALLAVLGRILPVPIIETAAPAPPLPEKLVALRERVARRCADALNESDGPTSRRLAAGVRLGSAVTAPVLLVGEDGTGKRWLARLIHFRSAARERSFAVLDAARLPAAAIAGVLFGGRVATVYIKEPGRLPHDFQAKLADLLSADDEERPMPRIMAGCCGDPMTEVRSGRLLEELHAYLAALTIPVPPLRERLDELPHLIDRMLRRANEDDGRTVRGPAPDALVMKQSYTWPGNLRELFSVLVSARVPAKEDRLTVADLPAPLRLASRLGQTPSSAPEKPLPLEALLEETERRLIRLALGRASGNRGRAAEILGVWRPRLVRAWKRWDWTMRTNSPRLAGGLLIFGQNNSRDDRHAPSHAGDPRRRWPVGDAAATSR